MKKGSPWYRRLGLELPGGSLRPKPLIPARPAPNDPHLQAIFDSINEKHFDGFLIPIPLKWNSRLRSSAGRFIPGSRHFLLDGRSPVIEVATYLKEEANSQALIEDTIGHEMIHYWLWTRSRPYGHTPEFHEKLKLMGVSRYNPVPRTRPYRYVYRCPACEKEFFARRKLGVLACAGCCKRHANGRFDGRYRLRLERPAEPGEGPQRAQPDCGQDFDDEAVE